jgi:hypothetical protein
MLRNVNQKSKGKGVWTAMALLIGIFAVTAAAHAQEEEAEPDNHPPSGPSKFRTIY